MDFEKENTVDFLLAGREQMFCHEHDGYYCKLCRKQFQKGPKEFKSVTRKEFFEKASQAKQPLVFNNHLDSEIHQECVVKEKQENPNYVDPPHQQKKKIVNSASPSSESIPTPSNPPPPPRSYPLSKMHT
jgi:hypothetical protein